MSHHHHRHRKRKKKLTQLQGRAELKSGKRIGRPPIPYNKHVAEMVCLLISTTPKSLRSICKSHKKFPKPNAIYRWLLENDDFAKRYARAKELQTQILADQMISLADNCRMGEVTKINSRGKATRRISDMVDRAKLQIDTRKWVLSKLIPHKYGDKIQVDAGADNIATLLNEMGKRSKKVGQPEDEE